MSANRVVVGVDGSPTSFEALDAAAVEARLRGAELELVYCVADVDESGPILRSAATRVGERSPGLPVVMTAVVGDPAEVLAERGRSAALTVVGTRGLGGFAGLLMHSVSQRLAAHADGPVLVVRGGDVRGDLRRDRPGGVLLGLESDDDADAALFAFEEAGQRGARLEVLHAWTYRQSANGTPGSFAAEPVAERVARQAAAKAAFPGQIVTPLRTAYPRLPVQIRSIRSTPCRALIEATANADLVVIAAHRRHSRRGIQLGPVTHALLHHSSCSVAIVPVVEG